MSSPQSDAIRPYYIYVNHSQLWEPACRAYSVLQLKDHWLCDSPGTLSSVVWPSTILYENSRTSVLSLCVCRTLPVVNCDLDRKETMPSYRRTPHRVLHIWYTDFCVRYFIFCSNIVYHGSRPSMFGERCTSAATSMGHWPVEAFGGQTGGFDRLYMLMRQLLPCFFLFFLFFENAPPNENGRTLN